jgi:hypothetical protein
MSTFPDPPFVTGDHPDTREREPNELERLRVQRDAYKAAIDAVGIALYPSADEVTRQAEMDFGAGGAVDTIRCRTGERDRLRAQNDALLYGMKRILWESLPMGSEYGNGDIAKIALEFVPRNEATNHPTEAERLRARVAELEAALKDTEHEAEAAIALLKRGQKALNRVGWEPGETDQEWLGAVSSFVGAYETAKKIEAEMKQRSA